MPAIFNELGMDLPFSHWNEVSEKALIYLILHQALNTR